MQARLAAGLVIAGAALAGARGLRAVASDLRDDWPTTYDEPYAPSPSMAPYVSLGQRELLADLLWIRTLGYFGKRNDTADGVAALIEATQAADPHFARVYTDGPHLMMSAHHGLASSHFVRAAELAERGLAYYPEDYEIADLAGTIYSARIPTDDSAQKRAWREHGAMLIERALRMPGASAEDATYAAYLRTTLGEHERAVRELKETALITNDRASRREIAEKLAELEQRDANELEVALADEKKAFEAAWQAERPELPATMYVIVGPRAKPYIDFHALATDRDLIDSAPEELEPIDYSR
jgi:hypothetical protein